MAMNGARDTLWWFESGLLSLPAAAWAVAAAAATIATAGAGLACSPARWEKPANRCHLPAAVVGETMMFVSVEELACCCCCCPFLCAAVPVDAKSLLSRSRLTALRKTTDLMVSMRIFFDIPPKLRRNDKISARGMGMGWEEFRGMLCVSVKTALGWLIRRCGKQVTLFRYSSQLRNDN